MSGLTIASLTEQSELDLGSSHWMEIDQPRIDAFADITEDPQWIHVDAERAATGPFGTTIAHGYLTMSLIAPVLNELFVVDDAVASINYGANKIRFPAAVPVGSRLRGRLTLVNAEPVAGGVQANLRVTMEIEGGDKPACVAEVLIRLRGDQ
ncbi:MULTISPECIES: MaoC family dehydratase [Mycolicibacterium]|uniref:Acyl dehydratase n=2 Tax=Mycolicibacterium TaxID=1866885 RepID=A0A378TAE4_9MYCO|nr:MULTISPECIES: MaoC family dehydratase [Mycolicibacterium]ANW63734.1 dehydratase [Mycobacterium sp. djl-10]BBY87679.1 MaoC family dehydratase [Mycolicibacterium tokaiense]GFG61043.1 MaoC family dehydratase [Mycolicibacterium murale]STZ57798.1 acyl dehydratase [Mycolicibacterium tokaiense]